jgi:hypothetical protein
MKFAVGQQIDLDTRQQPFLQFRKEQRHAIVNHAWLHLKTHPDQGQGPMVIRQHDQDGTPLGIQVSGIQNEVDRTAYQALEEAFCHRAEELPGIHCLVVELAAYPLLSAGFVALPIDLLRDLGEMHIASLDECHDEVRDVFDQRLANGWVKTAQLADQSRLDLHLFKPRFDGDCTHGSPPTQVTPFYSHAQYEKQTES